MGSHEVEIDACQQALEKVQSGMETLRAQFLAAAKSYAVDAVRRRVEAAVRQNHERSQQLGVEGLRGVKAELAELERQVPDLVETLVGDDAHWTHRSMPSPGPQRPSYWPNSDEGPLSPIVGRPLADVESYADVLLERNGLIERRFSPAGRSVMGSDVMRKTISSYASHDGQLVRAVTALKKAITERDEAAAGDLWSQA